MIKILKEAFSINKMFSRKPRYSRVFYQWREDISFEIHLHAKKLQKITKAFNKNKHAIEMIITRYVPKDIFYTTTGSISQKSGDISNYEKPLIDAVMIKKCSKQFIKGIFYRNLEIDDCALVNLHSYKRPTRKKREYLELDIKIVSNRTFK